MFRLDYLPSGLKLTWPDQPRRGLLSFIPLHCSARAVSAACADSNIETSRQKTFVRLNKVVRGKEFDREWCSMCGTFVKYRLFNSPTPAVAAVVDVVVRMMIQRCCGNRLD